MLRSSSSIRIRCNGSGIVLAGAAQHPEVKKIFAISGRDFGKEARRIAQDLDYARQVAKNLEDIRAPKSPVYMYRILVAQNTKTRIESFQDDHEFLANKDRLVQAIVNWLRES